ncbi:fumarylacetoacetase [Variovorax sp. RCC_210]|uniref:fumarylacetoacetase n=1 Tax=Variovorax sp. RCC_210 TaxID=3239217 RepID=UPI003523ECD5
MSAPHDTHAPDLMSWVEAANDPGCPFPIQNLPFGRFRREPNAPWSIGVAIGDKVLDLCGAGLVDSGDMAQLLAQPASRRLALREAMSLALRWGGDGQRKLAPSLFPLTDVELGLPCDIRNYSDFFIGIHHASNAGRLNRPDAPLLPNYRWVPIGYHGRASTVQVSGHDFPRPKGQVMRAHATQPVLQPSERMDFELEMGIIVGQGNAQGTSISMEAAERHIFGLTLLNDWSARDLQAWEAQPLGPFLAKSFMTTVSPWIVTTEALRPFRKPTARPKGDPQPLPYLDSEQNRASGAVDVGLEVWLQTAAMRASGNEGECIVRSNFADAAYWTMAQLMAHHTINGCALLAGDLLGTGTLSGAGDGEAACLLEITGGGKQPIKLSNGEERYFLQDDDTVILRGRCERPGYRWIGFGECRATVREAMALPAFDAER